VAFVSEPVKEGAPRNDLSRIYRLIYRLLPGAGKRPMPMASGFGGFLPFTTHPLDFLLDAFFG